MLRTKTGGRSIRQWWKEAPDANIGIATGSVSGLVVLDIDVKNGAAGAETLAGLESSHDGLRTLRVQTPSGGTHLYFAYGGHDIGSRTGLLPGLDIRSNGGYVVAPPSGLPGGFYQWLEEVSEPAPLPDSLQPLLREQEGEAHAHGTPFSVDDLHVGNDIKTLIREGKPKGQRSEALFGVIRAMVTAGHSNDEIAAVMLAPANGLSEKPREQGSAWLQAEIGRARVKDGRAITKRPQAAIRPPPANPRRNPLDNIRSAAELMKLDLPEPRWIVPDLLPAGLTLFAGKSKMGKSWWALQTALEVAGNGHSVLYLALEDSQHRLKSRIALVCQDDAALPHLDLIGQGEWLPLDKGGLVAIREWLTGHAQAALVIVDTLAKVRPRTKGNSNPYEDDYEVLGGLKQIADEFDVGVLVIHHLRKAPDQDDPLNEISGTTGLVGCADTIMVLRRPRCSNQASLFVIGRDIEEKKILMTWDPDVCRWTMDDQAHAPPSQELGEGRKAIIELLDLNAGLTLKEIIAATGKPVGTIKSRLSRMLNDGQVVNKGGKYYKQGTIESDKSSGPAEPTEPVGASEPNESAATSGTNGTAI